MHFASFAIFEFWGYGYYQLLKVLQDTQEEEGNDLFGLYVTGAGRAGLTRLEGGWALLLTGLPG